MTAPWILLAAIAALAVVYVLLPVIGAVFARFRAPRALACPEAGTRAEVAADAGWAAFTAAFTRPVLRIKRCSLWPGRSGCAQKCLRTPSF